MTVAVITGATSGLGRLVALDLARRGMRLAVVARDPGRLAALRREIPVDCFVADLSSLRDVRRAGTEIAARYDRIDLLVNNAGVHTFAQRVTDEGLAEMTAVNYLAPWLLTATLRDRLAPSARVVNVASEAARQARSLDPVADIASTATFSRRESLARYGRTKLMDIMFTQELGRRLSGVSVNCCDPGFNTTGLGRELPFAGALEKALKALHVGDPQRGAGIITRLCTDPQFDSITGGYFSHRDAKPLDCPPAGRSEQVQRELWDATAALVNNRVSLT